MSNIDLVRWGRRSGLLMVVRQVPKEIIDDTNTRRKWRLIPLFFPWFCITMGIPVAISFCLYDGPSNQSLFYSPRGVLRQIVIIREDDAVDECFFLCVCLVVFHFANDVGGPKSLGVGVGWCVAALKRFDLFERRHQYFA